MFLYFSYLSMYFVKFLVFFFFKQKTAYEMRISDWSSDVCSSDLSKEGFAKEIYQVIGNEPMTMYNNEGNIVYEPEQAESFFLKKIGRASCRERVCQYV